MLKILLFSGRDQKNTSNLQSQPLWGAKDAENIFLLNTSQVQYAEVSQKGFRGHIGSVLLLIARTTAHWKATYGLYHIHVISLSPALPSLPILDTPLNEEKHVTKLCHLDVSAKNQQSN